MAAISKMGDTDRKEVIAQTGNGQHGHPDHGEEGNALKLEARRKSKRWKRGQLHLSRDYVPQQ
jgi:hypothetical protein